MHELSERQRQDAIAACDRIQELCKQQEKALEDIVRILDNLANRRRDPKDGIEH